MRTISGSVLMFLSFLSVIWAIKVEDIPNPMKNPAACGRSTVPKSAICDPDNILTKDAKDLVEGRINSLKKGEIGVAVIRKIEPSPNDVDQQAKTFAQHIHNTWGVGDADSNDGAVLFLSLEDRVVYISTGKTAAKHLTSSVISHIIDNMRPYLRAKQYDRAIEYGVVYMTLALEGKANQVPSAAAVEDEGSMLPLVMLGGAVLAIGAMKYYEHRRQKQLEKGKKALEALLKEVTTENSTYLTSTCPICLEDFPPLSSPQESSTTSSEAQSPTNDKNKSPNRPMSLPCGHIFCYSCLMEYLKANREGHKCPICRQPMSGEVPPSDQQSQPPRDQQSRGGGSFGMGEYDPDSCYHTRRSFHNNADLLFRLNRMHFLYPHVMSTDTHRMMQQAVQTGSQEEFIRLTTARHTEVTQILRDEALRAAQRASGRNGSSGFRSGGFGGGRSSGGGGGRW